MADLDVGDLASQVAGAMIGQLAAYGSDAESYAKAEAQKIAISIAHIGELLASGAIDEYEAKLKFDIQRNATRTMLTTVEGIGIIAAEQAINAGLNAIKGLVNGALKFALLP